MSMLSAQCDELRELATRYDELQAGAVKAVTMPSNMGSILCDAADTIWELRGSVHRERAEADRLRDELDSAKHDLSVFSANLARLGVENAKLRELVRDMMRCYFMPSVIDRKQRVAALVKRAHELGVKEDDDELAMEVD